MIKLKEARKAKGMTQTELAQAVSFADPTVDQTMISVLERGDIYPGQALMDAFCTVLECEEGDLYDGVEALFVPANDTKVSDTTKLIAEIFTEYEAHGIPTLTREHLRRIVSEKADREIPDRTMREWISKARREGMIIANCQDGSGYYRPETREDLENQYIQNQHRAMAILAQQKHIRRRLRA